MSSQIETNIINGYCAGQDQMPFMDSLRVADMIIAVSYFAIPLEILYFGSKNKTKPNFITWLFVAFILSCGLTHLFQVFFNPVTMIWVLGILKWLTAVVSSITAVAMIKAVPKIVGLENQVNELNNQIIKFSSYIFHEIRNPLSSAMMGTYNVLNDDSLEEGDFKNILTMINEQHNKMSKILNDALDLQKIQNGKFSIERREVKVADLTDKIVNDYRTMVEVKDLLVNVKLDYKVKRKMIEADAFRIGQCLSNLMSNAIKYTPPGGKIDLEVTYQEPYILFSISDTGCGISEADMTKLFKPYAQVNSSSISHQIGTGLGLVISKQIAELHDGDIDVQSVEGQGSIFILKIRTRLLEEGRYSRENVEEKMTSYAEHNLNILIVDDNRENCLMMKHYLKLRGIKSEVSYNGKEAVTKMKSSLRIMKTNPYHFVIMDKNMPVMDGIEAVTELRKLGVICPIFGLTGASMENQIKEFVDAGLDEVMIKPFDIKEFDRLMKKYLEQGSGSGGVGSGSDGVGSGSADGDVKLKIIDRMEPSDNNV